MELSQNEFRQQHLERVSRSFAFCISQLGEPLRTWVGLSYLMCRVLDTIEDAEFSDVSDQLALFSQFEQSIQEQPKVTLSSVWYQQFPGNLPKGELLLLKDVAIVISQFHELPDSIRPIVREMACTMSQGMKKFTLSKVKGVLRLQSVEEFRRYCYVVAGTVGEALSQFLARVDASFQFTEKVRGQSIQFGEFLQRVNIIKDQGSDEKLGRFLIPQSEEVWDSSLGTAEESLKYLESLPEQQLAYRRFCGWSLFLGLETLKSIRQTKTKGISREQLAQILERVDKGLQGSGAELRIYFQDLSWQIWPHRPRTT